MVNEETYITTILIDLCYRVGRPLILQEVFAQAVFATSERSFSFGEEKMCNGGETGEWTLFEHICLANIMLTSQILFAESISIPTGEIPGIKKWIKVGMFKF